MILQLLFYATLILQILISTYLLLPAILIFATFFSRYSKPVDNKNAAKPFKAFKFGVIVTAHQETKFLPPIVDSILKQGYSNFEAYIVADDCDITGLKFEDERIHLLRPPTPLNTNTKSINYAVDRFAKDIEVMVLFDPDNLLHPDFLETLNSYYNKGYLAVQGNLISKTLEGSYEKMDNVGVLFYNFIDRSARTAMNLSVNIWGCGVSVLVQIFKKIRFEKKSNMGGFDKYMQAEIVKRVPILAYAEDALFYDEKISDPKNLESQRIRWINSYFKFLSDGIKVFWLGIKRRNFNLAFFGYNLIRPPYFLQILVAILLFGVGFMVSKALMLYWAAIIVLFLISFLIIVTRHSTKEEVKGIFYMPLFFYHQIRSLLKLRINKKSILKTEHFKVLYIDDVLKQNTAKN